MRFEWGHSQTISAGPAVNTEETRSDHFAQAGLELLASSDTPTSTSQSTGITDVGQCPASDFQEWSESVNAEGSVKDEFKSDIPYKSLWKTLNFSPKLECHGTISADRNLHLLSSIETGFLHIGQAGLKLLTSGDLSISVSQSAIVFSGKYFMNTYIPLMLKACGSNTLCLAVGHPQAGTIQRRGPGIYANLSWARVFSKERHILPPMVISSTSSSSWLPVCFQRQVLPRLLECSGTITAHYSFNLLGSSDAPTSAPQSRGQGREESVVGPEGQTEDVQSEEWFPTSGPGDDLMSSSWLGTVIYPPQPPKVLELEMQTASSQSCTLGIPIPVLPGSEILNQCTLETGFHHVGQAGFKLLISSDPSTSSSQTTGHTEIPFNLKLTTTVSIRLHKFKGIVPATDSSHHGVLTSQERCPSPDPKRGFLDLVPERIQGKSTEENESKFIRKASDTQATCYKFRDPCDPPSGSIIP
ncbi:hypothetical protein AAY473_017390 [Plecturocebus cupreus]